MGLSKRILLIVLVSVSLLAASAGLARAATPGIYEVWGNSGDVASRSYVKGGQIVLQWKDVEPSRGTFDWSGLYAQLDTYYAMGKTATVQINSTDAKPAWLWSQVGRCGTIHHQAVPQYWDTVYQT